MGDFMQINVTTQSFINVNMADHLNSGVVQELSLVSSVIAARGDITHRDFNQTTKLFESKIKKKN